MGVCLQKLLRATVLLFILVLFINTAWAAFPVKKQDGPKTEAIAINKNNFRDKFANIVYNALPNYFGGRHHQFRAYSSQQKSGAFGILSFVAAILALLCILAAALILYLALPASIASLALFTFPRAMYFYLGLSTVFSGAAIILGLCGIKRKKSGFAIAGFLMGAIFLLAGITILSNI